MMIAFLTANAQTVSQKVRGTVKDEASDIALPGALICIDGSNTMAAISDQDGKFLIENIGVGRHNVVVTYVGYEPAVIKEMLVTAGKESVLNIPLRESANEIEEVVVTPKVNKQQPLNSMSLVGARMMSVEEASRYAGGASDPARLASVFAGASSGGATNGISIHGASPQLMLWRIEGVEVPNPNHFADITGPGAGVFSSLSALVLGNSDFITGGCSAEYSNAVSGVFDMKLRNGNADHYEHAIQVGTLGIDLASEGPFKKGGRASYLFNYRYSTLGLASKAGFLNMDDEVMDYQDLNLKVNIPTKNAGTFSVWSTGLIDHYNTEPKPMEEWETVWDMNASKADQYMIAGGFSHKKNFSKGGQLRTAISVNANKDIISTLDVDMQGKTSPNIENENHNMNLIFDAQYQKKVSAKYTFMGGFSHTHTDMNSWMNRCPVVGKPLQPVFNCEGTAGLTRAFVNNKMNFGNLSMILGINVIHFSVNDEVNAEPRFALTYKPAPKQTIGVSWGLYSRKEKMDTYFVIKDGKNVNENLGLTKAQHVTLTYSNSLSDNLMLKIEPFFQYLYDVPVEPESTFSMVNNETFFTSKELVNEGVARNYGVDITLERYLKNGLYGMITATIYNSEYQDWYGKWRTCLYNRNFVCNILGGKEWMVGENKKNLFGINARLTLQGGERYTPYLDATLEEVLLDPNRCLPWDDNRAYENQVSMQPIWGASVKYTINKKSGRSHHFVCEFLHSSSFNGHTFDLKTKEMKPYYVQLNFPNIAYRLEF